MRMTEATFSNDSFDENVFCFKLIIYHLIPKNDCDCTIIWAYMLLN